MEKQGKKQLNKTVVLVGLFAATAIAVTAGCGCSNHSTYSSQDVCRDDNDDGYCDDNHYPADHSTFIYIGGHKTYYRSGHYPSSSYSKRSSSYGGSGYYSNGSSSYGKSGQSSSSGSNGSSSVKPPSSSSGTGSVVGRGTSSGGMSSGKSGVGSSSGSSSS